jgi:hypothetical protein
MKKAIVGTVMLALVRAGGVFQHLIGPPFYSTAERRLLRENFGWKLCESAARAVWQKRMSARLHSTK